MDKLYVIIPAYNEEDNIDLLIRDWYPLVEKIGNDSRLVIIDDGSIDSTYSKILEYSENLNMLEAISKKNGGHGATILYGYKYAIEKGADFVFQTDSDGQTLPSEFWQLWEERNNYNMLIGNRKNRKDGLSRIMVTKALKLVIRIYFKENIVDANTPFRLMDTSTLNNYIDLIPEDYNLSNILLTVIYSKKKIKIKFFPITFNPRQAGVNSINMKKIFNIAKQAIKDFKVLAKTS